MRIITLSSGSCGNCYLLRLNNGKTIVLDAGIKFKDITHHPEFPSFKDISFVFISHIHKDHNKSLDDFKKTGCPMITYEMLHEKVENLEISGYKITCFEVAHNCKNYGIIIKIPEENITFCYVTDFYKMPKIEGVTHWLYEIDYIESYIDEMIDEDKDLKHNGFVNHNSLENAVEYFSSLKTKPQKIICCHLSASNSIKNIIKKELNEFADEVYIAEKGGIYGE